MHIQMTPYSFYICHVFLYTRIFTVDSLDIKCLFQFITKLIVVCLSIISTWFRGQFFFSTIALAVLTNLNRLVSKREEHVIF